MEFVKPLHPSKRKALVTIQPSVKTPRTATNEYTSKISEDSLYESLFKVVPKACLFTIVQEPVHSTDSSTPQCTSLTTQSTSSLTQSSSPTTHSMIQSTTSSVTESTTSIQSTTSSVTESTTSIQSTTSLVTESTTSIQSTTSSVTESTGDFTSVLPSKLIIDYFDEKYQMLDSATLLLRAKQIFASMDVSESESKLIEQCTKQQRESDHWFVYRKGRITASSFHDVYALKSQTDPKKLIYKLLQSPDLSRIPAVKWGIDHEDMARREFVSLMEKLHSNFKCYTSGLNINPHYPHLGASPDALTECTCCVGEGIVEIKCPFSGQEAHPNQLMKNKGFFLNEKGLLNRSHRYFTQVQGQLLITGRKHCDFVVWTPLGIHVDRIYEDYTFTEKLVKKLTIFYVEKLLPAIMTNLSDSCPTITQDETFSDEDQIYCYCRREESGKMIKCDNKDCELGWFHFSCVGIRRAPKGQWFCRECRECE